MADSDAAPKLTLDDLLAFGHDYEQYLKDINAGLIPPGRSLDLPRPMLDHFIAGANEALREQRERARMTSRPRGGRPRGGMGEQVERLVGNGVKEEDALRMVANAHRKSIESVQRARKKPPR